MDKLTILAKQHKDWVKIVQSFGEDFFCEDIVQETYLKIIRYNYIDSIVTDKVNKSLMYFVLRSVCFDHKKSIKVQNVPLDKLHIEGTTTIEKHEAFDRLEDIVESEMNNWHWYDIKLFKLYMENELSMREIAKETDISLTSIFHTLKNCKERLKENIGESIEDYLNEDFELI